IRARSGVGTGDDLPGRSVPVLGEGLVDREVLQGSADGPDIGGADGADTAEGVLGVAGGDGRAGHEGPGGAVPVLGDGLVQVLLADRPRIGAADHRDGVQAAVEAAYRLRDLSPGGAVPVLHDRGRVPAVPADRPHVVGRGGGDAVQEAETGIGDRCAGNYAPGGAVPVLDQRLEAIPDAAPPGVADGPDVIGRHGGDRVQLAAGWVVRRGWADGPGPR